MNKQLLCVAVLATAGPAVADTVTHFGDGVGSDVANLLDHVGIGAANAGSERTNETFVVPGDEGSVLDLTFDFERDTGGFRFNFGFYELDDITADPLLDREEYATQAIANGSLVFDDYVHDPDVTATFQVAAGSEIGFFLIPNNTVSNFMADPATFFVDPSGLGETDPDESADSRLRAPLFSVSEANPGGYDQMLAFADNDVTLFTFEDLARTGYSDADFTDLAFSINAELVPEPNSLILLSLAMMCVLRGRP